MTQLHDLYDEQGQSPWLDNLRRGWITGGELARWVERGVRGITSNPTIFQKAIAGSADVRRAVRATWSAAARRSSDAYWALVTADIERRARASCGRCYDESDGVDGFVSLEVAPDLARDTDGTIAVGPRPARPHRPSPTCS